MKLVITLGGVSGQSSHPSRGAWIEITRPDGLFRAFGRRTPHGVRGLKYLSSLTKGDKEPVAPLTGCVD